MEGTATVDRQVGMHNSPMEHMNAGLIPDGVSGSCEIKRIIVDEAGYRMFSTMEMIAGRRTRMRPGTYCGLYRNGHLWMSDTPDEGWDHVDVIYEARRLKAKRVLINGLGIGMIVNALLHEPTVEHIDVVEIDKDVIDLVEPHLQKLAWEKGKTLVVHCDDAYTIKWKPGTKWDVAWHDIWLDAGESNLKEMEKLHRRYGIRVQWQGSWKRRYLLRQQRREQNYRYAHRYA